MCVSASITSILNVNVFLTVVHGQNILKIPNVVDRGLKYK